MGKNKGSKGIFRNRVEGAVNVNKIVPRTNVTGKKKEKRRVGGDK